MSSIQSIIVAFIAQLVAAVEADTLRRASEAVANTFGVVTKSTRESIVHKIRKPRAKQFCPVPGCKGVAAPIFGMVCGEHRDVAKSKIAKYRAERKASKNFSKAVKIGKSILKAKKKLSKKR